MWRRTLYLLALSGSACSESGDASCDLRERVDDHNIYSCMEGPDLDADGFEELENICSTTPGRENYVASSFHPALCRRSDIVGGCVLGSNRRLWYYPNEGGYPSADDMFVLCSVQGLEAVPPP